MSRAIEATCVGGIVSVAGLPLDGVTILSEGVADSEGVLILQGEEGYYLPKNSPDLKTNIENAIDALTDVSSVLNTIGTALTSIAAGMTGPTTAPPPTIAADVATIVSKAASITVAKVALETLKESLK